MNILRKPYLASFLAFIILFTSCNGEELIVENEFENFSSLQYQEMLVNLKENIDSVIAETKTNSLSLQEYKIKLLNGELSLTKNQDTKISELSSKLDRYGKYLAQKNNVQIDINDTSATLALGGLYSPEDNLDTKYEKFKTIKDNNLQAKIDNPWLKCAAIAIGADALWALGGSSASAWTAAAMTKAFTAVAKRFLGPIGVAIAVVSFGVCMASE